MRYGSGETKTKRKKKGNVIPGKSLSGIDFNSGDQQSEGNGDGSTTQDEGSYNEQSSQSDFENEQFTNHDEVKNEQFASKDKSDDGQSTSKQGDSQGSNDIAVAGCSRGFPSTTLPKDIYNICLKDGIPNMPLVANFASGKGQKVLPWFC